MVLGQIASILIKPVQRTSYIPNVTSKADTFFVVTCFEIWRNRNKDIFPNMKKNT